MAVSCGDLDGMCDAIVGLADDADLRKRMQLKVVPTPWSSIGAKSPTDSWMFTPVSARLQQRIPTLENGAGAVRSTKTRRRDSRW